MFAYASIGGKDLPSSNVLHEGPAMRLGAENHFIGSHVMVPRRGIALHINAFNFPIWGMLEKFAPSFLAGMPCMVKPASATSYVAEAAVRLIVQSGLVPEGALQLIIGGTGDLFERLEEPDCRHLHRQRRHRAAIEGAPESAPSSHSLSTPKPTA